MLGSRYRRYLIHGTEFQTAEHHLPCSLLQDIIGNQLGNWEQVAELNTGAPHPTPSEHPIPPPPSTIDRPISFNNNTHHTRSRKQNTRLIRTNIHRTELIHYWRLYQTHYLLLLIDWLLILIVDDDDDNELNDNWSTTMTIRSRHHHTFTSFHIQAEMLITWTWVTTSDQPSEHLIDCHVHLFISSKLIERTMDNDDDNDNDWRSDDITDHWFTHWIDHQNEHWMIGWRDNDEIDYTILIHHSLYRYGGILMMIQRCLIINWLIDDRLADDRYRLIQTHTERYRYRRSLLNQLMTYTSYIWFLIELSSSGLIEQAAERHLINGDGGEGCLMSYWHHTIQTTSHLTNSFDSSNWLGLMLGSWLTSFLIYHLRTTFLIYN